MEFLGSPATANQEWWLYGYRTDEVELSALGWIAPTDGSHLSGTMHGTNHFRRNVQAASIPFPVLGYVAPRPDTGDQPSLRQGAKKRLIHERPQLDSRKMRRLSRFVDRLLPKMFKQLQHDQVFGFEEWLAHTNYPEWRKVQLRQARSALLDGSVPEHKIWEAKMFAKDEFYLEYKYHRTINARSDYMKTIIGPMAASIERVVFQHPAFIKKIPRFEWPDYIIGRCSGREHGYASDYSSFEASFVRDIMKTVEMKLYVYMSERVWIKEVCERFKALAGWNKITAKAFFLKLLARRLSGEMVTSLGNGFSNLVVNLFVLKEKGCKNVTFVVEGDDGLFMFDGPCPSEQDFLDLGFIIKLTPVENLNEASFCGVVFDSVDRATLADPYKCLATVSWLDAKYVGSSKKKRTAMAQVKGLSLLAQYPGCPVLQSVALWLLRVHGYQPSRRDEILAYAYANSRDWWQREVIRSLKTSPFTPVRIGEGSRLIVEKVYGMSVGLQNQLEQMFDAASAEVDLSSVHGLPLMYKQHWNQYVVRSHKSYADRYYPTHLRPRYPLEGEDRWASHTPVIQGYVRA